MSTVYDTFTIRLTDEQRVKLAELAAATDRSRGAVIRRLVDLADVAAEPDLVLAGPIGREMRERRTASVLATDSLEPTF